MSLGPAQISDLVALGAPILCLDTCTILDVSETSPARP